MSSATVNRLRLGDRPDIGGRVMRCFLGRVREAAHLVNPVGLRILWEELLRRELSVAGREFVR